MSVYKDAQVEDIEDLLTKLCFKIKKFGRLILDDYNITPPQFDALQIIICRKNITISELSSELFQAPSTVTDLIDRMEKNMLVERIRDTKDKRIVRIVPLTKGYDVLNGVVASRCKFIDKTLSNFSQDEKESFQKQLKIMYEGCQREHLE